MLDDGSFDDGESEDQLRLISSGLQRSSSGYVHKLGTNRSSLNVLKNPSTNDSNLSEYRDPPLPAVIQTNGVVHAVRPSISPLPQIIQTNGIVRSVRPSGRNSVNAKSKDSGQQQDVPKMIESTSNHLIPSEVKVRTYESDESPNNKQSILPPPPPLDSTEVSPDRNGKTLGSTNNLKEDDPLLKVNIYVPPTFGINDLPTKNETKIEEQQQKALKTRSHSQTPPPNQDSISSPSSTSSPDSPSATFDFPLFTVPANSKKDKRGEARIRRLNRMLRKLNQRQQEQQEQQQQNSQRILKTDIVEQINEEQSDFAVFPCTSIQEEDNLGDLSEGQRPPFEKTPKTRASSTNNTNSYDPATTAVEFTLVKHFAHGSDKKDSPRDNTVKERQSVRFHRKLVTQIKHRPTTHPDDIEKLYFCEKELELLESDRASTMREQFEVCIATNDDGKTDEMQVTYNNPEERYRNRRKPANYSPLSHSPSDLSELISKNSSMSSAL